MRLLLSSSSSRTTLTSRFLSAIAIATRTMAAQTTANENLLTVHSSFRDEFGGQVRPRGLEWHLAGDSLMAYAPISEGAALVVKDMMEAEANPAGGDQDKNQDSPTQNQTIKRWIVTAHNKWSFARDWPMRQVKDIVNVHWHSDSHQFKVEWDPDLSQHYDEQRFTIAQIDGLLKMDKSAKGEAAPSEVWINGYFVGMLQPDTLDTLLKDHVASIPSRKLLYRKSPSGIIRIERRFTGMIVGQDVFEHVMDNLYALEDAHMIDAHTFIGTATLPDWIMGGELTSRLWIQEDAETGNIQFLRPLYRDDIETSDRRYTLRKGKDDARICLVKKELDRLRYLTTLPSPYCLYGGSTTHEEEDKSTSKRDQSFGVSVSGIEEEKKETVVIIDSPSSREMQHKRNSRRRFFGL